MDRFLAAIIILLLFAAGAFAQMPARMDSLSLYITEEMSMASGGTALVTTKKIFHAINRGIQEVCDDFPALEKIDTLVIYSDSEGVALPADFLRMKAVWRMHDDSLRIPLDAQNQEEASAALSTTEGVKHEKSSLFSPKSWHTFETRLLVTPKWNRADSLSLQIYYYARDTWKTAGDSSTQVHSKYREKIIEYAISVLWRLRSQEEKSTYYKALYLDGVTPRTREEEGTR